MLTKKNSCAKLRLKNLKWQNLKMNQKCLKMKDYL